MTNEPLFYPRLAHYIATLPDEFAHLPEERKIILEEISQYIFQKIQHHEPANLLIICTHNSRRSHMGQLWLQTGAVYYKISKVKVFSGGMEATAFHPHAIAAVEKAGFRIETKKAGENPVYQATLGNEVSPMPMFSKRFSDPPNPTSGFCAIMVCTEADQHCPVVPGADKRIALPYSDPKEFDGTPDQTAQYDARCRQIAAEMFYIMRGVKCRIKAG